MSKINWTTIGRGTAAALVVVNGGLATLDISDGLRAFLVVAVSAAIAFLTTVLPQPIAILRRRIVPYLARLDRAGVRYRP